MADNFSNAFDDAFLRVLEQLATDLSLGPSKGPLNGIVDISAEDLRRTARLCLQEAETSSDQARKAFMAEIAFGIAQLAERAARAGDAEVTDIGR